jgi:hypothetical protein
MNRGFFGVSSGTTLAKHLGMTACARIRTLRGLAPSPHEIGDDDILEVDGQVSSSRPPPRVTVPPPSGKRYLRSGRYSMVAPIRRRTLRLIGDEA